MSEPIYVSDPEYFQAADWSPEQLREVAQSMSPANVDQVVGVWKGFGADGATQITDFTAALRREIESGWSGAAASAADAKADAYGKSAEPLKADLHSTAGALDPIYQAATRLKGGAVPEVQGLSFWDHLTPWKTDTDDEYYRRHREALDAMNNIYVPGVVGSDGTAQTFTKLPEIATPPTPGPAGPNPGYLGGPGSPGPGNPAGSTGSPTAPQASPTDGPQSGAPGSPMGEGAAEQSGMASGLGTGEPASTGAASSAGMPVTGGGLGDTSRMGSAPSAAGAGVGGGIAGGGAGGGIGGGVAGGIPPAAAAAPKAPGSTGVIGGGGRVGGTAGVGGARPMGMGGMMGAGGARGAGGNDDTEHQTPGYLITLENGNELIGKMPTVAPPVIGA
ncbi:MAG: hypothetical protein GX542_02170 [Rhodococcus sp.]|nr:hypothetical protein [Rhodococcus sp. (in: high G+C Gram-positive bacteria)]